MNIPVDYNCLTKSDRECSELEYRVLLHKIPLWRRIEIETIEKDFAKIELARMNSKFEAHWSEKNGGK
jgi:hypothetical protein